MWGSKLCVKSWGRKIEMWRVCWRRPRSLRISNPLSSLQRPETLGFVGSPDQWVRCNVRWRNGFVKWDSALQVREQGFSASRSRRLNTSLMMSSGRLGSPASYVTIGRGGGAGRRGPEGMVTSPGLPHSRSRRTTPDMFPIGIVSHK